MILAWSMLFAFLVGPAALAGAKQEIHWAASYEAAFQEANDRGVPIVLIVMEDGEEANEGVWASILQSKEFIAAAQGSVNVLGNRGKEEHHGFRMEASGNTERKVCKRFGGGIDCLTHNKMEVGIFRDYSKGGVIRTPTVIIALPDQTVVAELVDRNPLASYLDPLKDARTRLHDGLTWDEAEQLRQDLGYAEAWIAAGQVDKVISFATPIAARSSKAGLIERTRLMLKKVEDVGTERIRAVDAMIAAKDFLGATDLVDELVIAFRGSRIEKVVKARKADLLNSKEAKTTLAQQRREKKAREILERADRLLGEGKAEEAERLHSSIREKYADTEAGRALLARGGNDHELQF